MRVFAVPKMRRLTLAAAICGIAMLQAAPSQAQQATEIRLTYSNGQFQPSQVSAPADKPPPGRRNRGQREAPGRSVAGAAGDRDPAALFKRSVPAEPGERTGRQAD